MSELKWTVLREPVDDQTISFLTTINDLLMERAVLSVSKLTDSSTGIYYDSHVLSIDGGQPSDGRRYLVRTGHLVYLMRGDHKLGSANISTQLQRQLDIDLLLDFAKITIEVEDAICGQLYSWRGKKYVTYYDKGLGVYIVLIVDGEQHTLLVEGSLAGSKRTIIDSIARNTADTMIMESL